MTFLPAWLTQNEQSALADFAAALLAQYGEEIILVRLFGSKARGDFDPDSDLDVCVLTTHDDWMFRQAISFLAADISLAHDLVLSPYVISLARWDLLNREGLAIVRNIWQEGIALAGDEQAVLQPAA